MMCRYCVTGYQSRRSDIPEKMTPAEAGVREYCANTREIIATAMI